MVFFTWNSTQLARRKASCCFHTDHTAKKGTMSIDIAHLDAQIESLRDGNTLSEHEVNALCDKVRENETKHTSGRALGRAPMKADATIPAMPLMKLFLLL